MLCVALLVSLVLASAHARETRIVTTEYGDLEGETFQLHTGKRVSRWHGVPFAKPITPETRFNVSNNMRFECYKWHVSYCTENWELSLSSLATIFTTTCGASSDKMVGFVTIFGFQCCKNISHWLLVVWAVDTETVFNVKMFLEVHVYYLIERKILDHTWVWKNTTQLTQVQLGYNTSVFVTWLTHLEIFAHNYKINHVLFVVLLCL